MKKASDKINVGSIPAYVAPESMGMETGKYVVDINDTNSVASVLKHHIDHFDEFLQPLAGCGLFYGTVDKNGKFKALKGCEHSEETFIKAVADIPELLPLLEEYARMAVAASRRTQSGPWTSDDTVVGQFAVVELATRDKKYMPLLKEYMEANAEIKHSEDLKATFESVAMALERKWDATGEDPEEKKFKKWLVNFKTDLDYRLETGNDPDKNSNSSMKISDSNIRINNKNFPKFFACIKDVLSQKKALPKEKLIDNAYHVLNALGARIPLKRLAELVENGELPSRSVLDEPHEWAYWEQQMVTEGTKENLQSFAINFKKKEDLESTLQRMVEHFDDYCMFWRYSFFPDSWYITNLSRKNHRHNERDLYIAIAKFPELEPLVTAYVEKITEANRRQPLLTVSGKLSPRGLYAAAVMAFFNDANNEKMLAYIKSFDVAGTPIALDSEMHTIGSLWREIGRKPELPKTFAAYPDLQKVKAPEPPKEANAPNLESIISEAVRKGDINAKDDAGRTPLHYAVMQPRNERQTFENKLAYLLENGADVNAQDNDGNTAIHLTAYPGGDYLSLLFKKPNLKLTNNAGKSALDCIMESGFYGSSDVYCMGVKRKVDSLLRESN